MKLDKIGMPHPIARPRARPTQLASQIELFYLGFCLVLLSGGLALLFFDQYTSVEGRATGDTSFGVTALGIPAYIYTLLIAARWPGEFVRRARSLGLLWGVILLSMASVIWSIDHVMSLRRIMLLLLSSGFGVAMAVRLSREQLAKLIGFTIIVLVAIQFISAVVMNDVAMPVRFYPSIRGLFTQRNTTGRILLAGFVAGLALWGDQRNRATGLLILIVSGIGILATLSMSAIGATMLSIAFYYAILGWRRTGSAGSGIILLLVAVGIYLVMSGIVTITGAEILSLMGRDDRLSGRTQIWATIWHLLHKDHWWFGFGYETFFSSPRGVLSVDWNMWGYLPPHAHDGVLQVWLDTGLVGVMLVAIGFAYLGARATRYFVGTRTSLESFDLCFLFYFLCSNVTETSMMMYGDFAWILVIAVATLRPPLPAVRGGRVAKPRRPMFRPATLARHPA